MTDYSEYEDELLRLEKESLKRDPRELSSGGSPVKRIHKGKEFVLFCSNDYLGLTQDAELKEITISAIKESGLGSGASRLISGTTDSHIALEKRIAAFKGKESAIIYPTGYMTNLGIISTIADKETLLITDKLNHASIIDGCRASGAKLRVYPHRNTDKLARILERSTEQRKIIITDSIFSMDGDCAPLPEIIELKKQYHAMLIIDEAHATGVIGKKGAGLAEYYDCEKDIDINIGTLSKGVGLLGGYAAMHSSLREYLINKSRPFIYTTSQPAFLCRAAIKAIDMIEEGTQRRRLESNRAHFEEGMRSIGIDFAGHLSSIYPVIIGDEQKAVEAAEILYKKGLFVPAVRTPTVAKGQARLRITLSAAHTHEQITQLVSALKEVL